MKYGPDVHAAQVQFYARIIDPSGHTVRLAIGHFYKMKQPLVDADLGTLFQAYHGAWATLNYPVELEEIDTKFIAFIAQPTVFFTTYSFQSKIK